MFINLQFLSDYSLLFLRLAIAAIFLAHGLMKLKNWKNIPVFFKFLGICEVLGSLSVATGLLTQFSAIGFILVMLGALHAKIFKMKAKFIGEKGTGWELDLIILAAVIVLFLLGAGKFSLDALAGFYP